MLTERRRPLNAESTAEPPLRQIIEVLQQVMCTHDAEKLAIAVLEIYEGGHLKSEVQSYAIPLRVQANLQR
ncbi:MAG: hypothetical protein ACXV2E_08625 [Halobacteriota archaeon]